MICKFGMCTSTCCLQKQVLRIYQAISDDNVVLSRRLITDSLHAYQNWCGQTFLHWAVLKCNHDVMTWLCKNFPNLIDVCDNVRINTLCLSNCCRNISYVVIHTERDAATACSVQSENAYSVLMAYVLQLLRSPLHYASCLYGKDSQEARMLAERGASWETRDCVR